jgi:uncharacterized protein YeaO (DUF488 family)
MDVLIKRIYEPYAKQDGFRILVDRLWPRGIKKEEGHIGLWLKEAAPSTTLRQWFNHEADKWKDFIQKYKTELQDSGALDKLAGIVEEHKTITLIYSAKEEKYNQAAALQSFLKQIR